MFGGNRSWFVLQGMLSAECLKLENQARFVLEKIQGSMTIENKAKRALIALLDSNGYDSDPVKKWKETMSLLADLETNGTYLTCQSSWSDVALVLSFDPFRRQQR